MDKITKAYLRIIRESEDAPIVEDSSSTKIPDLESRISAIKKSDSYIKNDFAIIADAGGDVKEAYPFFEEAINKTKAAFSKDKYPDIVYKQVDYTASIINMDQDDNVTFTMSNWKTEYRKPRTAKIGVVLAKDAYSELREKLLELRRNAVKAHKEGVATTENSEEFKKFLADVKEKFGDVFEDYVHRSPGRPKMNSEFAEFFKSQPKAIKEAYCSYIEKKNARIYDVPNREYIDGPQYYSDRDNDVADDNKSMFLRNLRSL